MEDWLNWSPNSDPFLAVEADWLILDQPNFLSDKLTLEGDGEYKIEATDIIYTTLYSWGKIGYQYNT